MKEFLYILFCVVILGLGILLLNSQGGRNSYLSDYHAFTHPGVDFEKMSNIKTSYTPAQRNVTGRTGLVGSNDNFFSKNNNYGITNQNGRKTIAGTSPVQFSSVSNFNRNSGNNDMVSGFGASASGGSVLLMGSGGGSSSQGTGSAQGGFLASRSTLGNNFISAPIDPFRDYNEGDITHPGGSPLGDPIVSVPVGDGMLPLFLMGLAYVFFIFRKRNRRKLVYN